jgi:cytochrome c oxidase cbb3-type subunit III
MARPPQHLPQHLSGTAQRHAGLGRDASESTIWELVSYVQSIGHPSGPNFGRTISRSPPSPKIQQTPAEFLQTANPWAFTEPFTDGQPPNGD